MARAFDDESHTMSPSKVHPGSDVSGALRRDGVLAC